MGHIVDQQSLDIDIVRGEGCELIDASGRRYLDFIAGWCVGSIGWAHPEIRSALIDEANRGTYLPPFLKNAQWEALATRLTELAPGNMEKVFPCTSGSESVDMAVKCVRAATGKNVILSIDDVYHGHTYGAASVGDAKKRITGSILPDCEALPMPGRDAKTETVLDQLEKRLKKGDVAAFLSEPVWTNAGAYIPPPEFYPRVQELCREYGALLVMDEVATGFGHCGTLFASEIWNLEPDIITVAKAFTGGYATMGATIVTEEVYEKSKGIPCYSTFGWLQTDLAATMANVEIITRDRLWENAKHVGNILLNLFEPLKALKIVKNIRGIGLVLAIELKGVEATDMQRKCADKGLILETAGPALFMTPALVLQPEEAKRGADIIHEVLAAADGQ